MLTGPEEVMASRSPTQRMAVYTAMPTAKGRSAPKSSLSPDRASMLRTRIQYPTNVGSRFNAWPLKVRLKFKNTKKNPQKIPLMALPPFP